MDETLEPNIRKAAQLLENTRRDYLVLDTMIAQAGAALQLGEDIQFRNRWLTLLEDAKVREKLGITNYHGLVRDEHRIPMQVLALYEMGKLR